MDGKEKFRRLILLFMGKCQKINTEKSDCKYKCMHLENF